MEFVLFYNGDNGSRRICVMPGLPMQSAFYSIANDFCMVFTVLYFPNLPFAAAQDFEERTEFISGCFAC